MAATNAIVELFYSGAWHDITATNDVYARDPIVITRGRADEVARIGPSTCTLTIENRDGKYSPRNPTSPLFGLIGRNTLLRVRVGSSVRFVGEVESWPQRWNTRGNDVWAPITAYGIMRRLNAPGTVAPLVAALTGTILSVTGPAPIAYWPLTDGDQASRASCAVAGVDPLARLSGTVTFDQVPGPAGTGANTPDMRPLGVLYAKLPVTAATGELAFGYAFIADVDQVSTNPTLARTVPVSVHVPGGGLARISTVVGDIDFPYLALDVMGAAGTNVAAIFNTDYPIYDGRWHYVRVTAVQSGGNVNVEMFYDGVSVGTAVAAAVTLPAPTDVTVNPQAVDTTQSSFMVDPLSIAAVSVWNDTAAPDLTAATGGYVGETAADRIARLCAEAGVNFTLIGTTGDTVPMGAQRLVSVVDSRNDAAEADGGILYEPRDTLRLVYRTNHDLYNQTPDLALNYSAGSEVAPPLDPVEDTDHVGNDVTVTRTGGGSSRLVQETGTLNVQEPGTNSDAVGRIPRSPTLVLATDEQTLAQAGWIRHLGTWDEPRYPVVNLDLTAMNAAGKTTLAATAIAVDVGDRFTIANPPAWLPPGSIDQLAQGFTEVIETHRWGIAVNATPAGPYTVAELNSATIGRLDATNSTLASDATATATGLDVASVGAPWITTAAFGSQFPFDIMIDGERMTVTAIVNAGPNQTFTVTRSVNGVVKAHLTGAPIHVRTPARLAR